MPINERYSRGQSKNSINCEAQNQKEKELFKQQIKVKTRHETEDPQEGKSAPQSKANATEKAVKIKQLQLQMHTHHPKNPPNTETYKKARVVFTPNSSHIYERGRKLTRYETRLPSLFRTRPISPERPNKQRK